MLRIDHVVLLVRDIVQASRDFGGLGFNVVRGGEHTGGETHNALIPFADSSYIELLAWKRPPQALRDAAGGAPPTRWSEWRFRGEGLVDFALGPDDLEAVLHLARRRGLEVVGPVAGGRARPDGVQIAWELGLVEGFDLPFLCADVTSRALRVPEGPARLHKNGVIGIRCLTVDVKDVALSAGRYQALLGVEPVAPPVEGAKRFQLGDSWIDLEWAPAGEGVCALELICGAGGKTGLLSPRRTHGAAIEVVEVGEH